MQNLSSVWREGKLRGGFSTMHNGKVNRPRVLKEWWEHSLVKCQGTGKKMFKMEISKKICSIKHVWLKIPAIPLIVRDTKHSSININTKIATDAV